MQSSRARRVFLLDSHDIFRLGVRSALSERAELTVVGESSDPDEGIELVARTRPHVVVIGIREHEGPVLDRLPSIQAQYPPTEMLVLSRTDEEQLVDAALRGGAKGYLPKDIAISQLVSAVHSVASGHNLLASRRAMRLASRGTGGSSHEPDPLAALTPQERKILSLIGEGLTNRQIADRLYLVEKTVRNHVTRMLAKLGVERRTQAALLSARLHHTRSSGTSPHLE